MKYRYNHFEHIKQQVKARDLGYVNAPTELWESLEEHFSADIIWIDSYSKPYVVALPQAIEAAKVLMEIVRTDPQNRAEHRANKIRRYLEAYGADAQFTAKAVSRVIDDIHGYKAGDP